MILPPITSPAILSLLLSSVTGAYGLAAIRRATTCNGHAELCDRSFGNVTFVGAHNSYAVGSSVASNQDYDITQQLNDGVRMLQSQVHNKNGTIELCHTSCDLLYDGGSLQDYLTTVKKWMDANPNDVVSLLIVNSDDLAPSAYDAVFKAAGLDTLVYAPETPSLSVSAWPTLGSLIDSGKRLVVFMDAKADFNAVPYIISEFTSIWETKFDVTTTFDCEVDRVNGNAEGKMYLINHFLDKMVAGFPAPDRDRANTTNAASGANSLGEQVQTCIAQHGLNPNFMLVDFYEYGGGSVFQVAADANGMTYSPASPVPSPKTADSSSSPNSSASVTSSPSGNGSGELRIASAHVAASFAVVSGIVLGALSLF